MKIIKTTNSEKFSEKHGYRRFLKIKINGKEEVNFIDGEPEDANLSKHFSDCYSIISMMKKAHKAGVDGEEFIVTERIIDDFE